MYLTAFCDCLQNTRQKVDNCFTLNFPVQMYVFMLFSPTTYLSGFNRASISSAATRMAVGIASGLRTPVPHGS